MKTSIKSEMDRRLNAAIQENRAGRHAEAIALLNPLAAEYPKSAAVVGYLAGVYFGLNNYVKAEKSFRKASRLSPKSELASLGLFHSLWNLGRRREAFREMRRLLKVTDSEEYKMLLRDLAVAGEFEREFDAIAS
jgi:predicted Zn-dependent protease